MTQKLDRLPGTACKYYILGKCLYEEWLNPGLNTGWRCRIVLDWTEDYEKFVDRAELFNLDVETVSRMWEERFTKMMVSKRECPDFCPGGEEAAGCAHEYGDLCHVALPSCNGMCRHFVASDKKAVARS